MRRWLYFARLQVKFADHLRLSGEISWPARRRHPEQKRPRLRPNVRSRVLDGGQDRRIDDAPDRRDADRAKFAALFGHLTESAWTGIEDPPRTTVRKELGAVTGDLGLMSMPFGSHVQEEFAMAPSADEGRKIAEKVLPQSETSWTKARKYQARRASEENYLIVNEVLRQFNLKFLERGGGSLLHVPLALSLTMLLNIFDVLIIEHGEVGPSFFVRTKELVELGVKSLGIAVFGSINEQRHQPRC